MNTYSYQMDMGAQLAVQESITCPPKYPWGVVDHAHA